MSISDKNLHAFLVENDYLVKSKESPSKILKIIPKDLHNRFLLGLIDGDGCFYYHEKRKISQFSVAGTYEQDWTAIEKILSNISIKNYKLIRRKHTENSYSSSIRITNRIDIKKLGEYVYPNNKYGLKRKYEKYCKIINI